MNGQLTWFEVITIFLSILGFILTAFGVVMWFNFRKNVDDIEKLKEDFSDFKVHVASNHPTADAMDRVFQKLEDIQKGIADMFGNIRDRLEQKADKS
jgi:hypothetical protein